jgi:transposase
MLGALRRRFYELHLNGSSRLATQTVTTMAALWKIEGDIRGLAPAARMDARQQRSAAIVAELFNLWEMELPRILGKSKLAEAIRYATSRRKVLECFLTDGRRDRFQYRRAGDPASKNHAQERAVRGQSDGGGRTWQQSPP